MERDKEKRDKEPDIGKLGVKYFEARPNLAG
jgi:hypothetical protein